MFKLVEQFITVVDSYNEKKLMPKIQKMLLLEAFTSGTDDMINRFCRVTGGLLSQLILDDLQSYAKTLVEAKDLNGEEELDLFMGLATTAIELKFKIEHPYKSEIIPEKSEHINHIVGGYFNKFNNKVTKENLPLEKRHELIRKYLDK